MKKTMPLLFFLLMAYLVNGQKLIRKTILKPGVQSIVIDGSNCYQVNLKTHNSNELKVEAAIEGEYAPDLAVRMENEGNSMHISAGFLPNFRLPNDKLGAHKVLSISLVISIPEHSKTLFFGTNTNIFAGGNYRDLSITSGDGNCVLDVTSENLVVKTQKGEIIVKGARGSVEAKSEYGKVCRGNLADGNEKYRLHSIEGDISINMGHE